ncbi:MAG: SPOR domain-containing protein [Candidatus Aminicenantes bacterium]|nr:SPOR domain-containing protein [Candidatus Aminicenantes bacterium]
MEKTYFDIRVTFVHVVIFLIAVIAIGIFLFYMGYQAGHRLGDQPAASGAEAGQSEPAAADQEKISLVDEKPVRSVNDKANGKQSIPDEMKLHEKQLPKEAPLAAGKNVFADQNYAIQVGAFSDFANAQKYSEKFARLGYQTEIIVETINRKKLHTVRVGSFVTLAEAQKEKDRLEGLEKKQFKIKKGH